MDLRDVDSRVRREIGGEALGIPPFGHAIQLAARYGAELPREDIEVYPFAKGFEIAQATDGFADGVQIGIDNPFDAGAEHLHHHSLTSEEPGTMNLPQRCRPDRFRFKGGKQPGKGPSEITLDLSDHGVGRRRWYVILQAREFLSDFRWKQIYPRSHELSQLDEDAAQFYGPMAEVDGEFAPTREGRLSKTPQSGPVQEDIPPEDVQRYAEEEAADLTVATPIGSRFARRSAAHCTALQNASVCTMRATNKADGSPRII
jgi:hypothetical protein